MKILKQLPYPKAIKTCRTTIINREFILNEVYLGGTSSGLRRIFSEEQQKLPIPIKFVSWEGKDGDYIDVWYQEIENVWKPIHALKFSKSTIYN
ncbi:hypothetical protein [Cochleicola gelatinilyticus]|nr:hypothetical protein [Cochleicola gelatinilyticus]